MTDEHLNLPVTSVLLKSAPIPADALPIRGYDFNEGIDYERLFDSYLSTGFQATSLARAIEEVNRMIVL